MNCYECGEFVTSGTRFCRQCGAPALQPDSSAGAPTHVLQTPSSPLFAPPSQQSGLNPPVQYTQPQQQMAQPYYPQQQMAQPYPGQQMPGYQPVNVNIYNTNQQAPGIPMVPFVVVQTKSVAISLLLTFFFGPLGMLYSTVGGAIAMILISIVVSVVTFGVGLILTWPICMIWGAVAASQHNQRAIIGPRY